MTNRTERWLRHLGGALVGTWLTLVLALTAGDQGFVRDEGIYFEASRRYATWLEKVVENPSRIGDDRLRDRYFRINAEHPDLLKLAAGLSATLFAEAPEPEALKRDYRGKVYKKSPPRHERARGGLWPVMPESAAMRLPAQIIAGLGAWVLFVVGMGLGGRRMSAFAGLIASVGFFSIPRVFFHAGLHCFDVAAAVVWLMLLLSYHRALYSRRWSIALGPILGLAIAVKHNALVLGVPIIALHYYSFTLVEFLRARRTGLRIAKTRLLPAFMVSMGVLAPVVAWLCWPWLWHDGLERFIEYIEFHRNHSYYNIEFLGQNHNLPPLPIAYPFVMMLATVPSTWLCLAFAGYVTCWIAAWRRREVPQSSKTSSTDWKSSWWAPLCDATVDHSRPPLGLWSLGVVAPMAVIALPSVPIFGGTKHWLASYTFVALFAAYAWTRLWDQVADVQGQHRLAARLTHGQLVPGLARLICSSLVLAPGLWSTIHAHPYNISQYNALIGGARGAATFGLNRGYWGSNGVVELMQADGGGRRRIYLHDHHHLSQRQAQREGLWPQRWQPSGLNQANAALFFHERHMCNDETQIWNQFGSTSPNTLVKLDDVPLTSFYLKP